MFVVSAPSGAGKTTLCHQLIATVEGLRHSVSYTTRQPREGEVHGRDYHFVDEVTFRAMLDRNEFVEWASVYGKLYGTPRQALEATLREGVDVLLEIDVQGAEQVRRLYQQGVFIYILPPSLDVLQTRLHLRGRDSADEIERRLSQVKEEVKSWQAYDYVVRNDDVKQALRELEAIVLAERIRVKRIDARWMDEFVSDTQTEAADSVTSAARRRTRS
ncbi:MAG: guanylate kinase [Nitrospirae bacterium]|nr:guanylate kinase [Nitrospirota bacterium]